MLLLYWILTGRWFFLKKGNAQTSKKSESTIDSQVVQDRRTRLFSDSRLPWMFLLIDSTHWKGWCPTFFLFMTHDEKTCGKKIQKITVFSPAFQKKNKPPVFFWSKQKTEANDGVGLCFPTFPLTGCSTWIDGSETGCTWKNSNVSFVGSAVPKADRWWFFTNPT